MERENDLLQGKRILIVDDEPDILVTVQELLPMCHVRTANNFSKGKVLLENEQFDLAILDIMGVEGYKLLDLAKQKNVIAVMLTAHALNTENIRRSYEEGAASYLPKDELANIATYLNDVLEARQKGKHSWWRWFDRLGFYFSRKFGPDWDKEDKESRGPSECIAAGSEKEGGHGCRHSQLPEHEPQLEPRHAPGNESP